MTSTEGANQETGPTPAESVHDAAVWARNVGYDQLSVALHAVAGELGYQAPADSTAPASESTAPAVV